MSAKPQVSRSQAASIGSGLIALLAIAWYFWTPSPPQLGQNERVFSAVDALFTAVTAKSDKLLAECEDRLRSLQNEGLLAEEAFTHLDSIVSQAKTGEWQPAARRLYKFMRAQRREVL
jgi:hypothetical protein